MPRILSIDIETYSSAPLPKCGVYRYVDAPDFEILLFSYAFDDEPVQTIDMASGEELPPGLLAALDDPAYIKMAYNAQFERVCLSKYLGHWLDPAQWRCTAVMAAYNTLPGRLGDTAVTLGVTEKKMEEGKELIRYFSVPCKPTKTNGERTRNLPKHAPDKWAVYKQYNAQDVETERAVRKALEKHDLPEYEWELYALDQIINDRGVRVDRLLVKNAMAVDQAFSEQAFLRAKELTGLDNPGSVSQLKAWLADQDMPMESLAKKLVQEKAKDANGIVGELLNLRLELSKTSVKKYEAMARTVCRDGRVHGLLQFGGASRTMRWAGRLVQAQNLPQNHLPDLSLAREIVKSGDEAQLELLFGSVPSTLSELIRTAFIPKDGCRFIVADFSAIEARVLAWLAGEEWVLEEFHGRGKIYEATASRMYHIPADTIVKGNPNYEYRQKGKQATLSCGYTVPDEYEHTLVEALQEENIMRSLVHVITTASGDRKIPLVTSKGNASWVEEEATIPESDDAFGQITLSAHKVGSMIRISEELLHDSAFDLAGYISSEFARRVGAAEEDAILTGNGTHKPTGLLHATLGAETGVTAAAVAAITADELIDLQHSLKAGYRRKAVYIMNDATVKLLRKLKDGNGQFMWQPGLLLGQPDTLLNQKVLTSNFMPVPAAGNKAILYGDYSYYWLADREGRSLQRLNELYAAADQVGFKITQRVDGRLILREAVKCLAMKAA